MGNKYEGQDRGSDSDYAKYYRGMNQSMQQKVALISSFLPVQGTVADMGCGSGQGSADLAGLYPGLNIIGVDINPKSVEYCQANHSFENLSFKQGDIAEKVFANESLDGIINSSVLHHVTSFNEFNIENVDKLLENQMKSLRVGGVLAIRDFVVPENANEMVWLELPTNDFNLSGASETEKLSSTDLFMKFCNEFRSSQNPNGPLVVEDRVESKGGSHIRFKVSMSKGTD